MTFWIAAGTLFILGQFAYYFWCTPERTPQPITSSPVDKIAAKGLYCLAYLLSLLRLPFAVSPYCLKLLGVLVLKKHYKVSHYHVMIEAFRVWGDVANWGLGIIIIEHLWPAFPVIKPVLYASLFAETDRLFAEKGQMILSALWQFLPHRRWANYLSGKVAQGEQYSVLRKRILRYCQYYGLDDESRVQYILSTLRCYAAADQEALTKLAYLSTLRITSPARGMRGGHVRDVARGEVFIHRQWTSDPRLLIGQALRRAPWLFDPRFLRRPFYYRSESNRLATLFVLSHARYCLTYGLYQFGHEIKAARYDFFYRTLRWLKFDIEPKVQVDGTFPFDQGISWLKRMLFGAQPLTEKLLWTDQDVIQDVRHRETQGEKLSAIDIAVQYTYPLKYVEEVLMDHIKNDSGTPVAKEDLPMIPEVRKQFNTAFRQDRYEAFVNDINTSLMYPADFKVCETPLFLSSAFDAEMLHAGDTIIAALQTQAYRAATQHAIPPGYEVPNQDDHPVFLQIDFAICRDASGNFVPRLIELQGFPSLYCFQAFLDQKIRAYFDLPAHFELYYSELDHAGYIDLLRRVIVADSDPERVILLEIEPEKQKTRIDFACTEQMIGIRAVNLADVIKRGRGLFYRHDGREIPIERIYNRVIRNDPKFQELHGKLWLGEEIDAQWVGHPNWYYKISKYSLPLLTGGALDQYVPPAYFVDQLPDYPRDLENYILKPLFLFSGQGVTLDVTADLLDRLPDKRQYILQRKVDYTPLVETPDGYSRAEVRMLYIWQDRPIPVSNLVRMSKGKMMGVRFNRDKTWVGSTLAYRPTSQP